ncbi:MAG: hypothetical protein KGM16_01880 [Bacteroidota bacterium]|nr:hypothetical protein [Bacteroidota bacterium]
MDELRSISPVLAEIEKVNVFHVPEGYFIDLDEKIATNVFLKQDEKNSFQKVPEGYFDSLSSKILSRINEGESAESEIKSISPALHYLKEEKVFTVPEDYFDDLSDRILNRINGQNTKIISFDSPRKWWKYAAAAIITGIITITSLQIFKTTNSNSGKNMATASENIPAYVQLASKYKTPKQLDQGIASLTDDEIARYLEKNTTILDDEALTKNTDTKELPTPDDYLIDDHALDNYLQKINVESTNKNTQ